MGNYNTQRYPLNGTFELTARCNLACRMCLIRIDKKKMAELGTGERTAGEWIRMAEEVREAGTLNLLLTGGEPLLRPDFTELYRAIAQMGFMLTLYTNATLVTKEVVELLKKYPPHRIGITVYGASPETYERVTGHANAYRSMLDGVGQLMKLPSEMTIRTTIIKDNFYDLDRISDWAFSLGKNVNFNVSRIVTKSIRGGVADAAACRLSPEQNVAMLKERSCRSIINPFFTYVNSLDFTSDKLNPENGPEIKAADSDTGTNRSGGRTLYGCEAGISSYNITWDGKLTGCQLLGDCWTYPFETGFARAWEDFPEQVKLPPLARQCMECDISCTACPATRYAETGSLGGFSEYLCREGKLWKEMKEQIVSELERIIKERGTMYDKV